MKTYNTLRGYTLVTYNRYKSVTVNVCSERLTSDVSESPSPNGSEIASQIAKVSKRETIVKLSTLAQMCIA